ncbi:hypothetical protein D3C72_2348270 [compost metagenome]
MPADRCQRRRFVSGCADHLRRPERGRAVQLSAACPQAAEPADEAAACTHAGEGIGPLLHDLTSHAHFASLREEAELL